MFEDRDGYSLNILYLCKSDHYHTFIFFDDDYFIAGAKLIVLTDGRWFCRITFNKIKKYDTEAINRTKMLNLVFNFQFYFVYTGLST